MNPKIRTFLSDSLSLQSFYYNFKNPFLMAGYFIGLFLWAGKCQVLFWGYEGCQEMKEKVIGGLKEIFDPELPVNIYDLGLIYDVECKTDEATRLKVCIITMTLTSATCSMSEMIVDLVKSLNMRIEFLETVEVNLVFDPPWSQEKMSDEAKLSMGFL